MSKYTKEEQTEIVRLAMNLEAAIQSERAELSRLRSEHFHKAPTAPVKKTINQSVPLISPNYPLPPKTDYSFTAFLKDYYKSNPTIINKLFSKLLSEHPFMRILITYGIGSALIPIATISESMFLIAIAGLVCSLPMFMVIYCIKQYFAYASKCKELNQALANSPEYLHLRADAERNAAEKQAALKEEKRIQQEQLDLEYAKEKEHYDNVIIPAYKKELAEWTTTHEMMIRVVSDDLNANLEALENLYEQTGLISKTNRILSNLIWLYEDMSTSEHDIERATDLLNVNINQKQSAKISAAITSMNMNMRVGFSKVYSAIEQGNYISAENNDILIGLDSDLRRVRRDMRNFNSAAVVQRHMTNKHLKKMNKQFEKFSR